MRCVMAVMDQKDSFLAVACARLVFWYLHAFVCGYPYFGQGLRLSLRGSGARFTAVRIRVRIRRMGKDCACLSVVLVLIRTLCSLLLFTGPDALHHGRYGPECLDGFLLVVHTPVVCNDICLWFRLQ